jgi:hypothetical protein
MRYTSSMTPDKRALIKAFIENRGMAAAVREALMTEVSPAGVGAFVTGLDRFLPDAEYGQRIKARAEAADLLERGFAQLKQAASAKEGVQSDNQARPAPSF